MSASSPAAPPRAAREADKHEDYFAQIVPEPFRILGLRLLPLSLGRYRLLKRFGVAFVADGDARAEIGDLLLGVLICSMRCDEFVEWAGSPAFARDVRRWSRRILPSPWLCLIPFFGKWWIRGHSFNAVEKIQLFQRYIEQGSVVPDYFDESGDPMRSGAHWSQAIEVTLRSELGWSAEEINEEPLTKALADYFKYAENQGLVRLMTPEDVAQGEANAAVFEKLFAAADAAAAPAEEEVASGS
jgi:hypothetical protein